MGWGKWLLLGDLGQTLDIENARNRLDAQQRRLEHSDDYQRALASQLARENAQLKLYVAALARLLVEKKIATRDEIERIVEAVDLEDGSADGQLQGDFLG